MNLFIGLDENLTTRKKQSQVEHSTCNIPNTGNAEIMECTNHMFKSIKRTLPAYLDILKQNLWNITENIKFKNHTLRHNP